MEFLADEVHRVITCPYLPALKSLHHIVQRDHGFVHAWARGNPCQIGPLAEAVLEGLELWPYSLDLLRLFSQVPAFRDAVLCQNPMLLDTLLQKATGLDSAYEKYSPVCIALLCAPLKNIVPAGFTIFLSRLLEDVHHALSYETIKPVYLTIAGLTFQNFDDLSTTTLSQLQDSLITVLMKYDVEETSTSLFSLAILARLASWKDPRPLPVETAQKLNDNALVLSQVLLPARQFFNAKRAFKTLDLVTLKAIMICSSNCVLNLETGLENLKLCVEILQAINSSEKSSWVAKNSAKIDKLVVKTFRPGIENELQLAALRILFQLSNDWQLLSKVQYPSEKLILKFHIHHLDPTALVCLGLADLSFWKKTFELVLNQACGSESLGSDWLRELLDAGRATEHLATWIGTSPPLCQQISSSMSTSEGLALLDRFVMKAKMVPSKPALQPVHTCYCAFQLAHQNLQEVVTFILLKSAFCYSGPNHGALKSTLTPLLNSRFSAAESSCTRYNLRTKRAPVSLFEARGTPQAVSISHDWKESLVKEISREAQHRCNSVTRLVGEISRDLELRCEEAERPLREEQLRSQGLEAKLQACQNRVEELETDTAHTNLQIKELVNEKQILEKQVISSDDSLRNLSTSLDTMRTEFQHAKANAQRTVENTSESARQQDLAYIAILKSKDEMYEVQAMKFAASRDRVRELEKDLADVHSRERNLINNALEDAGMIEELKSSHFKQEEALESKEIEISRLIELQTSLRAKNNEVSSEASKAARDYGGIIASLESQVLAGKVQMVDLEEMHRLETAKNAARLSNFEEQLQLTSSTLQAELQQVQQVGKATLEDRDATVTELENKLENYWREHEARERESAEAKNLLSKLTAVVGTNHNIFDASARTASKTWLKSRDQDAASHHVRDDVNHISNPSSACATLNDTEPIPTQEECKARLNLKSPLVEDGKRSTLRTKKPLRSENKSPLTALSESRSAPNRRSMAPRQSNFPVRKSSKHCQASVEPNENVDRFAKSDESFRNATVFTSPDQHQLPALDKDVSSYDFDDTTSTF